MNSITPWTGRKVRLVTFAWGKPYVDRLLERALAAALAPGNLPALANRFDCTVVVVTEEALFDYVRKHPVGVRIQSVCSLRLVAIDDLIAEPWQYGITLAYALFRGFSDLGAAMTDTFVLFLNADFILADGSYERLMPYMLGGHRTLLSPSYCAIEENVTPLISANMADHDGVISVPPRDLAEIILGNLHNTIRTKTVNQTKFHFKYFDQFYWRVDEHTLLGHQMPIALIGIRPEVAITDINTFWDWGVVYEFCPSGNLTVIGDSDEVLMLELRAEATHRELLLPGPGTPQYLSAAMSGYITQYQLDNAKFALSLHSRDLPDGVQLNRDELQARMQEVLKYVKSKPSHLNHSQWLYHQEHLKYFQETKARRQKIAELEARKAELERNEAVALASEWLHLGEAARLLRRRQMLERGILVYLHGDRFFPKTAARLLKCVMEIETYLFNTIPQQPWHPLWLAYRDVNELLCQPDLTHPRRLLTIGSNPDCSATQLVRHLPGEHSHCTVQELLRRDRSDGICHEVSGIDLCIIQLDYAEQAAFEDVYAAAKRGLRNNGIIVLHVINRSPQYPEWTGNLMARIALFEPAQVTHFVSGLTRLSSFLLRVGLSMKERSPARPQRSLIWAVCLWATIPFALFANLLDKRRSMRNAPGQFPQGGISFTARISP